MTLAEVQFGIMSVEDSINLKLLCNRFKDYNYRQVGHSLLCDKMVPLPYGAININECNRHGNSYFKDGQPVPLTKVFEVNEDLVFLDTDEVFLVDLYKLFMRGYKGELHIFRIFDVNGCEVIRHEP